MGVSMRVTQAVCRIRMSRIRLLRRRCCMALMTLMPLMPSFVAFLFCGWSWMCRLMLSWEHRMPMVTLVTVVRVLCQRRQAC